MPNDTSNEARLAVVETKVETLKEDITDIKTEVHEINHYLRNELLKSIQENKTDISSKVRYHADNLKVWGAIGIAGFSLAITLVHVFI